MMNASEALNILELKFPLTKGEVQQAFRRLAKKYHPDRYHNSGVTEAWATHKFIKIKEAYDVLVAEAPEIAEVPGDVSPGGDTTTIHSSRDYGISSTVDTAPSEEAEFKGVSIVDWLFERIANIENKILEVLVNALLFCILPFLFPVAMLSVFTFLATHMIADIFMQAHKKDIERIVSIAARVVLIVELVASYMLLVYFLDEMSVFGYILGGACMVPALIVVIDLLGYSLSRFWKRHIISDLRTLTPTPQHS